MSGGRRRRIGVGLFKKRSGDENLNFLIVARLIKGSTGIDSAMQRFIYKGGYE